MCSQGARTVWGKAIARIALLHILASVRVSMGWQQPRLLLSLWYDPVVPEADFPKRYKEIADANCTAIMGGFGCVEAPGGLPSGPECVEAQLEAAEDAGIGLIAAGKVGISDYGGASALWGYQLKQA